MVESFSKLLKKKCEDKSFEYHPQCKQIRLTYLCFADDIVLFCKATESISRLLKAFDKFCAAQASRSVKRNPKLLSDVGMKK